MPDPRSEYGVFVNCPFDDAYRPLFEAIVFAVHDCGYVVRSSLEVTDASQVRIDKIASIIGSCRLGIHDISRTELDVETQLPRFNMPLELGLFLGAKRFGSGKHRSKTCLILDIERYRYQKFISDIAGQDIAVHGGNADDAIKAVRKGSGPPLLGRSRFLVARRSPGATSRFGANCRRLASGSI